MQSCLRSNPTQHAAKVALLNECWGLAITPLEHRFFVKISDVFDGLNRRVTGLDDKVFRVYLGSHCSSRVTLVGSGSEPIKVVGRTAFSSLILGAAKF